MHSDSQLWSGVCVADWVADAWDATWVAPPSRYCLRTAMAGASSMPVAPSTRAASLIARSGSVHHEKRCSSWPVICRGAAQKLAHVQSFRFFSLFRSPAAGWNSAASRCSPMMSACSALVVMWIVAECSAPQQVHR